ncbi:MAG TPA: hypothetical protein VHT97_09485 [Acidimicrobiales bacterium]|nr:hypothetical protein [Acidimicrobiales bacterium]
MPSDPSLLHHRTITRAVAVLGLLGVALIHLLDLQSKFHETPYLGWAYVGLIVGTLATAAVLIRHDSRRAWVAALVLAGATFLGYALSRTTGLPSATDDIGNWLEPLGLASLFVESCVVLLSGYALRTPETAILVRAESRPLARPA